MDYAAIEAKEKLRYSEDVYYLNYEKVFELWLNGEMIESFPNLREVNKFLFDKYVNAKKAHRVYVYSVYFNEIYERYERVSDAVALRVLNKRDNKEPKAFRIYGGITYKDAKYYLGTDKTDNINPCNYCELIKRFHKSGNIKSSFTTSLRDFLFDSDLEEFGKKENVPSEVRKELYENTSLAPIIYAETNKEFNNVFCYDFDSAYISHYYKYRFPYKFTRTGGKLVDGYENFVRVKFINIRAKNAKFLPLSIADKKNAVDLKTISLDSKRVLMAKEVTVSFFYNLEMQMINDNYVYEDMLIEESWKVEVRPLPPSFLRRVMTLYTTKEEAKHRGEPYADKKVLLNRIHGFFLTSKMLFGKRQQMYTNLPLQIGFYTIALQRVLMYNIINKIGLKNIVSAHTDSIKTKGCFERIINEYNDKFKLKCSDTLGKLEFEGVMEKVVYFSNTRAKYIMDGKFEIKHGGIDTHTAEWIRNNYSYETLTRTSPYEHTLCKYFTDGSNQELKRDTERRVFSEGGLVDE